MLEFLSDNWMWLLPLVLGLLGVAAKFTKNKVDDAIVKALQDATSDRLPESEETRREGTEQPLMTDREGDDGPEDPPMTSRR